MGFFDKLKDDLMEFGKEKLEKVKDQTEIATEMGEYELIAMYKNAKMSGEYIAQGAARSQLKSRYGYTDDDFKNM